MKTLPLPMLLMPLVFACSLHVSRSVYATDAGIQSLMSITEAVQDFVKSEQASTEDVHVEVRPLDRRLRLAECDSPLSTYWSPGSRTIGRVTVQVECAAPRPWRVHVQSTVTLEGFVWSLSRSVERGEVLGQDLLVRQAIKLGANNAAMYAQGSPIVDPQPWLGYAFSQRVSAGRILNERMLKPARVVKKGESVLIRHRSAGLELQTKGVALDGAAQGERLQVRNSASGKIIDTTAIGKGIVAVLN
jgi:flagella basal body P-ring formation protein FlgA